MSVRTRSSARRNSGNSSLDEEEYDAVARPRRPPPPPPPLPPVIEAPSQQENPPPPPLPVQQEQPALRQERAMPKNGPTNASTEVQIEKIQPWKLMVRTEPTKTNSHRDLVRIWITPNMSPKTLAECIKQTCGIDNDLRDWVIAGLFREPDCLFVSLHDIIEERDYKNVYALSYPHIQTPKPKPWLTKTVMSLIGVGGLVALWRFGPIALAYLHRWSGSFFEVFVNLPLRELYRYGPNMVGWEGASLPSVCARITYHGDEDFWKRNMAECQQIFDSKEEAMLRMARPVLYLFTMVLGFWVARLLVREHAVSLRRMTKKPDRDMVETYQAFNVIFKQMSRAMNDRNQR